MKKLVGLLMVLMFLGSIGGMLVFGYENDISITSDEQSTKFVFGFWPNWAPISYNPQWSKLTHVAYFAIFTKSSGDFDMSKFDETKYWNVYNEAKRYGVKIIITIAAHDTNTQEELFSKSEYIDNLVNNTVNILEKYHADGIVFDFENYEYKTNKMTQLLERLRSRLGSKYQLFICVAGWIEPMYRDSSIAKYVDGVFLMAYDFHVANYDPDPNKEWAHYTGPVAPYDGVTEAVKKLEKYYPKEKIILGVPLYGYDWQVLTIPTATNPYVERAPVDGTGVTMDKAMQMVSQSQSKRVWDNKSKTPWYFYWEDTGSVCIPHQAWYEDMDSLRFKFDYVVSQGLGGVGFWALSYEGDTSTESWRDFWSLVGKEFWTPKISISEISFDREFYLPKDKVTMNVRVIGEGDINAHVFASIFKWSLTKQELVETFELDYTGGRGLYTKTFSIPESWLPGIYKVEVSATDIIYGDIKNSTWFVLIDPTIVEPTSKNPVYVGSPANPKPFYIKLSTGVSYLDTSKLLKRVWIDHRINPSFEYIGTGSNGYAVYKVYAPSMNKEGKYDLTIELYNGLEITENDAVVYSSSNNVDIVLVIDSSGSMHSYCGLFSCWKGSDDNNLRLKAAKMLVDTMDYGDGIAVVDFDWDIKTYPQDKKLLYISTPDDREHLKSFIDTIDASGGTYIGKGLKAAYDILSNSHDTYPKYVMLLTDGDDNSGDPYNPLKVAEDFKDKGWKVYTIGLTSGWYTSENRPFLNSDLLMKIADITGGRYYEADRAEVLLQIYNSIKGIAKNKNTLSSKSTKLKRGESTTQSVFVDPTVKEGEFSIAWSGSKFNLTLISPDGNIITPEVAQEDPNITYTKGDTYVIYEVKNPVPGEWKMNITAVDVPEEGEEVTSMVLADTNLTIDLFTEKNTYRLNEPIKLVGILTLNGEPVDGSVNATIAKPDGSVDYLALSDDDGNGIYETYYIPEESGSYTITLQAKGEINGVPFTRQTTFSVYVSGEQIPAEFKASIDKIEFTTVSGRTLSFDFTLNSTIQDIVRVGITSLSNGTNTIAVNYTAIPGVFSIVPDENVLLHVEFNVPFDAKPGNYTGSILVQGSNSVLTIPIELEIKPRLQYAPEDVSLYSTDATVDSVEVYEVSNETLKQITGEIPEIKNSRAFVVFSSGSGNFKLRIASIKDTTGIKVLRYDWDNKEWKEMPFEKGSVILPLSVDGFSANIILIGETIPSQTSTKESYANIITLSRVWTQWFFKYYDEFNELYVNATGLGIDNETLQRALELHNNATELIKDAWRANDLESIRNNLWRGSVILPVPKFWEIRRAYLLEKQAIEILRNAIKNEG